MLVSPARAGRFGPRACGVFCVGRFLQPIRVYLRFGLWGTWGLALPRDTDGGVRALGVPEVPDQFRIIQRMQVSRAVSLKGELPLADSYERERTVTVASL